MRKYLNHILQFKYTLKNIRQNGLDWRWELSLAAVKLFCYWNLWWGRTKLRTWKKWNFLIYLQWQQLLIKKILNSFVYFKNLLQLSHLWSRDQNLTVKSKANVIREQLHKLANSKRTLSVYEEYFLLKNQNSKRRKSESSSYETKSEGEKCKSFLFIHAVILFIVMLCQKIDILLLIYDWNNQKDFVENKVITKMCVRFLKN